MQGRLAILCPGQGGQSRSMFDLARGSATARGALEQWNLSERCGAPGLSLDDVLADTVMLFDNRMAQPLVVAATLANWIAVKDYVPRPVLAAGYSVGELSAYAVAGALSAQQAIDLASRRAQAMSNSAAQGPRQALVAISSPAPSQMRDLLDGTGFAIAIDTPGGTIVGGFEHDVDLLREHAIAAGATITVLPVNVASHTPLLQAAAEPFRQALEPVLQSPSIPVLAGISAEPVHDRGTAIDTLARQIHTCIRWTDCLDALAEAGITVALELGPCNALTRMLHSRHSVIECRSVSEFRSHEGVAAWVRDRLS